MQHYSCSSFLAHSMDGWMMGIRFTAFQDYFTHTNTEAEAEALDTGTCKLVCVASLGYTPTFLKLVYSIRDKADKALYKLPQIRSLIAYVFCFTTFIVQTTRWQYG